MNIKTRAKATTTTKRHASRITKVYMEVKAVYLPEGAVSPCSVAFGDDEPYKIDKVISARPATGFSTVGTVMRYTVLIEKSEVQLYLEDIGGDHRWFMVQR